nr:ABC transporter permease subunit [uncultured Acetatifactor sp.]
MTNMKNKPKNKAVLLKRQWALHMILWAGLVYLLIFAYIPMVGIIIAFKEYKLSSGVMGFFTSRWVGLKWFKEFFASPLSGMYIRNTIVLSALKLLVCFPMPILFALMLNEVRSGKFKKLVQTASYLPHFISWIIVSGLCFNMFSSVNGVVNELLLKGGLIDTPLSILYDGKQYWGLAVGTEMWKEMGWNAIIYIAAISGIDSTLYEAAEIDGASRLQRIRYVTLPSLKDIIVIMFILSLGGLVNGNLDQAMMLGNTINRDYSEIINSYVLKIGMANFRFDYAAAVGLMQSLISVALVFSTNALSRKATGAAIY